MLGLVAALGRFATITVIALAVQAPAMVYAVLAPGARRPRHLRRASGLVTAPLLRALDGPGVTTQMSKLVTGDGRTHIQSR